MRALTALILVAVTVALAAGSQYLIRVEGAMFAALIVYAWLAAAAVVLVYLLWLYFQIGRGPRVTVSEKTAKKMERELARALASKGNPGRLKRLKARARSMAKLIDPATEAQNVFKHRVRLTNAVMALIFVLSSSFWIFAQMAPVVWPQQSWFSNGHPPDGYHAALFSVDQVTRGTLFDLFDVFDWNMSGYHPDPANQWFSAFIVIYRFLIGGALIAAVVVRLGMHQDWREKAAHASAESMQQRLQKLSAT